MMEKRRLADPQAMNLYVYTRNNPLKYVDPNGEKFKGTDDDEVIIEREKVNGKKIWVIKSGNASEDLKKLVGLINDSGSRTANEVFKKLNKHTTMINLVIDTKTDTKNSDGTITTGLHQPHDKNGPLEYDDATDKFNGKAEPATNHKGAYKEATITLFQKRMEDLGYSGERLDGKLVATFGHEATHDLDPIQVQAGLSGTGSNDVWHPEKKGSPDYIGKKIRQEIDRNKGIRIQESDYK
jgi:hypothetical protein